MFLDYFALGIIFFVVITLFYGIIVIHDIPYEIAERRGHPHQDSIHVAGWVSMFTLHAIWPFLWIWATLYREDRGWGFADLKQKETRLEEQVDGLQKESAEKQDRIEKEVERLQQEVEGLSARLALLESANKEG